MCQRGSDKESIMKTLNVVLAVLLLAACAGVPVKPTEPTSPSKAVEATYPSQEVETMLEQKAPLKHDTRLWTMDKTRGNQRYVIAVGIVYGETKKLGIRVVLINDRGINECRIVDEGIDGEVDFFQFYENGVYVELPPKEKQFTIEATYKFILFKMSEVRKAGVTNV